MTGVSRIPECALWPGICQRGSRAVCDDATMPLVWVTGVSGSGKSSVCEVLRDQGRTAVDSDWEGFSRWVNRVTGEPVVEPPYPVPANWLNDFAWRVRPEAVGSLAASLGSDVCFLCGGFENEAEVRHFFDCVVCLVVDEATLRNRLASRTTNHFGKHPEELDAVLGWRLVVENQHCNGGAVMLDATQPLDVVAAQVVATMER
jgi:hypothetical protein